MEAPIRFDSYALDPVAGELRKAGVHVPLSGQPLDVLAVLVRRPGEVITREELKEALWPEETFVDFDNGVNSAIRRIRRALDDSATDPRFIETLPKRGYRFIAPLNSGNGEPLRSPRPRRFAKPLLWALAGAAAFALALTVWVRWVNRDSAPAVADVEAYQPSPVTSYPGYEVSPSFSPDGAQIVFAWGGPDHGEYDLYVTRIGSASRLQLTDTPESEYSPAWSPDGDSIAFARETTPGRLSLFVMPTLGGPARFIAEVATTWTMPAASSASPRVQYPSISWTPDGGFLLTADRDRPSDDFEQRLVSVESGEKRRFGAVVKGRHAAISPDGGGLAISRAGGLFVADLTNGFETLAEPKKLAAALRPSHVTWTSDSRDILVAEISSETTGGDLSRIARDGTPASGILGLGDGVRQPATSTADRLAFVRQTGDVNIWRAEVGVPGQPAFNATPLIASTALDTNPEYSADGSRIVFRSTQSGHDEIWVCDGDGANLMQVTEFRERGVGSPAWSPDGQWIAFDGKAEGESTPDILGTWDDWQIFIVRSDGGPVRRLTLGGSPAWSPDGEWIYYTQLRVSPPRLYRTSVSGGKRELLAEDASRVTLSPDGEWAYFRRDTRRMGEGEVWRIPAAGGEEELVVEAIDQVLFAVTDQGVYYAPPAPRDGLKTIEYLDLATRQTTKIYETRQSRGVWMDVSHDGRYLLFNQRDSEGADIMLVEGFGR